MTCPWWMDYARRAVRNYRQHPDFDDLLSEAYLAAWNALERHPDADDERAKKLVWCAALKGAAEFIRSPRNRLRQTTRYGTVVVELVSLHLCSNDSDVDGWRGIVPDFAPALLDRLEIEARLSRCNLRERDWRLLGLLVCGYNQSDAAEAMGVSADLAGKLLGEIRGLYHNGERRRPLAQKRPYHLVAPIRRRSGWQYRVQIRSGGKNYHLGIWHSAEEAAVVADAAIIAYGLAVPLNLMPEACR